MRFHELGLEKGKLHETPDKEQFAAEQRLEQWFQGPLFVATSSKYRLRRLSELGFKDIYSAAVDGEIEKALQKRIASIDHGGHFDPYSRQAVAQIARAKCEALLESHSVPAEAMVIAADTYPSIATYRTTWKEGTSFWKPEQLHKVSSEASREEVLTTMMKTFEAVWNGYERKLEFERRAYQEAEQFGDYDLIQNMKGRDFQTSDKLGRLPMRVEVHTGIAIRYPEQTTIETYYVPAALFPERIYQLAKKYSKATSEQKARILHRLAEQILTITEASKIDPRGIPGCINWGDPNIRRFLKTEEWNLRQLYAQKPEQGVYLGLPAKRLREFLLTKARELNKQD